MPFQVIINLQNYKSLRAFEKGLKLFPPEYKLEEQAFNIVIDILPEKDSDSLVKLVEHHPYKNDQISIIDKRSIKPDILEAGHYEIKMKRIIITPIFEKIDE